MKGGPPLAFNSATIEVGVGPDNEKELAVSKYIFSKGSEVSEGRWAARRRPPAAALDVVWTRRQRPCASGSVRLGFEFGFDDFLKDFFLPAEVTALSSRSQPSKITAIASSRSQPGQLNLFASSNWAPIESLYG